MIVASQGCADLCSADLAAAPGTSDLVLSGASREFDKHHKASEWRQPSGHLTCLTVGRVVLR